ncbi:hypothetical protein B0H19DRAFT_1077702 [Mycena capillaripes]|nr:hypothetical protein B0H19DRAFT_1077702 [Mycena capillaripes]
MSESSAVIHRRKSGVLPVMSSESPSDSSSSPSSPDDIFQSDESDESEETEKRSGIAESCELDEVVESKRLRSRSVIENSLSMLMKRQSGPRMSLHWESLVEELSCDELLELSLEVSESELPAGKSK